MKVADSKYVGPVRNGSEEEIVWRAFLNLVLPGKIVRAEKDKSSSLGENVCRP